MFWLHMELPPTRGTGAATAAQQLVRNRPPSHPPPTLTTSLVVTTSLPPPAPQSCYYTHCSAHGKKQKHAQNQKKGTRMAQADRAPHSMCAHIESCAHTTPSPPLPHLDHVLDGHHPHHSARVHLRRGAAHSIRGGCARHIRMQTQTQAVTIRRESETPYRRPHRSSAAARSRARGLRLAGRGKPCCALTAGMLRKP